MSEASHEGYEQEERERHITRAEIMHVLNDPASYSRWHVPLVREQSSLEQFTGIIDYSLEEWTEDILAAFRIDATRWSERVIDPTTSRRIDSAEAATIRGSLSEVFRDGTLDHLTHTAVDGYRDGEVKLTLELTPHIRVDMCGSGEVWVDPSGVSSDISYSAVFRKIA